MIDACRHGNNQDLWLLSLDRDSVSSGNSFNAWIITDTGITSNPINTVTGPALPPVVNNTLDFPNRMRFSPDAKYVVASHGFRSGGGVNASTTPIRLYSFDNNTGVPTFFCELDKTALPQPNRNYDVCFSPDSKKLYVSCATVNSNTIFTTDGALWQFDLSSGDSATIASSGTVIFEDTMGFRPLLDMQLGIDSVIYITTQHEHYIATISNPDSAGTACGFNYQAINLGTPSWHGLPNMIYNLSVPRRIAIGRPGIDTLCQDDSLLVKFNTNIYLDSLKWSIQDTSGNVFASSVDTSFWYSLDSLGLQSVRAITYSGCQIDTLYDTILVMPKPAPNLGPDTILCEGDTINFPNDWFYSYTWSTGDSVQGIQVLQPDTFWLELTNYCGTASDTVMVDSIIAAFVEFGVDDTLLCDGDTLFLDAEVDAGSYLWQDGFDGAVYPVTSADTFWVESQNACATSSDTAVVRFTDIPVIPELDSVLCNGDSFFIDLTTDSLSRFIWYDGDSNAFDTITLQNTYWVKEWNVCGHDSSDFLVAFVNDPQVLLGNDTVMCIDQSLVLDASTPFGTYVWNTGDTSGAITVDQSYLNPDSNKFVVTVYNACKSDTDDITIAADLILQPNIGNDTVVCRGSQLQFSLPNYPRTQFTWNNIPSTTDTTDSAVIFPLLGGGQGVGSSHLISATLTNSCGTFTDSLLITIDDTLRPNLGPDTIICVGDTVRLDAGEFPRTSYLWNDLSESHKSQVVSRKKDVLQAWVELINTCGIASDSIVIQVDSLPTNYFMDTVRFCAGSSVVVSIVDSTIELVEWLNGEVSLSGVENDRVYEFSQQANYHLRYTNHCGTTLDTLNTKRQPLPTPIFEDNQKMCGYELILKPEFNPPPAPLPGGGSPALTYLWSDGSLSDELPIYDPGFYALTVTDQYDCTDSTRVRVKSCGADFYAPNSFTPDGNGINDFWKPVGEGIIEYTVTIYDRWGHAITTFTDTQPGWDGTHKGQQAPLGTYHWRMELLSEEKGQPVFFNGEVVLLR